MCLETFYIHISKAPSVLGKSTSPGAFVTEQEDPGELCQDDQEGGTSFFNTPLQIKVYNTSFPMDFLSNLPGMRNML